MLFNGGWDDEHTAAISEETKLIITNTPKKCLNSVKAETIFKFINKVANANLCQTNKSAKLEHYKQALRNVYMLGEHEIRNLKEEVNG